MTPEIKKTIQHASDNIINITDSESSSEASIEDAKDDQITKSGIQHNLMKDIFKINRNISKDSKEKRRKTNMVKIIDNRKMTQK